jgi:hypothetical protein
MKPTEEFCRHHEVEPPRVDAVAFRQGWRVRTRLDRLLFEGAIDPDVWLAAVAYRGVYLQAFGSLWPSRSLELPAVIGFRDRAGGLRLDALQTMRLVRQRLGPSNAELVEECVIEDAAWAALGRQLHVDPKTARMRTVTALKALYASGLLR